MSIADKRPNLKFEVNFEDDPFQSHPAYLEDTAPIGFWRMEALSGTTEQDQTANNRDLTYVNAPTLGVNGVFYEDHPNGVDYADLNTAVSFNGTDESAATATSATWQNLTAAWTLAAWIYPTASRSGANAGSSIITGTRPSGTAIPFMLNYGAFGAASIGDVVWGGFLTSGGNLHQSKDTSSPTLNVWAHYAVTWDGATIRLYKNGVAVGTPTTPGVAASAAAANIAMQLALNPQGAVQQYFPGRIDEPAVWDVALRADQVANLYRYLTVRTPDEANYIDLSASVDLNASRVRSAPIRRGRSDSVSRVEAGTGTLILGNRDGSLSAMPPVNLLANPSAEVQTAGLPFAGDTATIAYDTTNVRSGIRAFKLTTATTIPGYASTQRDGLVGMRPGKTYTFSAYLYVPTGVTLANVRVEIVDEIAGSQDIASTSTPAALDAYHRLQVTKTIRDAADAAYVRVRLNEASDNIWIDDVQLEEAASATTYCDGDQTDCWWGGEPHKSLSHRKGSSQLAPKIGMPMRRFRLTGEWDGTDYGLLYGYVERWDWLFPSQGKDAYVVARLTDGTRVLANTSMRGFSRSSERTGDRVRAILAHAGVGDDEMDVNDETINTIALSAQAAVTDDRSALSMIRDIEETERGVFFISKDGLFTYQGYLYRSIEGREDLIITDTTDDTDQARYSEISISTDVSTVVNDVNIENVQNASNNRFNYPLSQARYFTVSSSEQSLWQTNVVSNVDRSVPLPYVDGLEIRPFRDPDNLWPAILGVELGALVRVERTHQGVDLTSGELHFLEGIEHDITPGNWVTRLRTAPTQRAPITADPWQTPIAKPIYLTNVFSGSGGSSVVIPSRLYTAGKLYLLFCSLHATGATAPVQPTFSGTNTWTSIRGDTGSSSVSWRHQTFRNLATSTVTEAITLSFAGQTPNNLYDVVLIEVSDGFNATTPVQDSNQYTAVSAFAGFVDVGTLTDARSIILAGVWKNANADTNWSGGVELYDRASFNNAYSVAYGYPPGVDRIDFSWNQANGFHGTGFEVQAP